MARHWVCDLRDQELFDGAKVSSWICLLPFELNYCLVNYQLSIDCPMSFLQFAVAAFTESATAFANSFLELISTPVYLPVLQFLLELQFANLAHLYLVLTHHQNPLNPFFLRLISSKEFASHSYCISNYWIHHQNFTHSILLELLHLDITNNESWVGPFKHRISNWFQFYFFHQ